MEDYDLVEADVQQWYHLDVAEMIQARQWRRLLRLVGNLPPESRVQTQRYPIRTWTWNDEVQSRILWELGIMNANYYNAHRKKGAKAAHPPVQFQPDYVSEAKEAAREHEAQKSAMSEDEVADLAAFWQKRERRVKFETEK